MDKEYQNHISQNDTIKVPSAIVPGIVPGIVPRMGLGYDVHRFTDGDYITLCGIKIPHTHGLLAHSDGDVALHAITDALYGAIANGDIGQHFPPSDNSYKNMDSRVFLQHACACITKRGGAIGNIDITIVTESPKIAPHRDAMCANIAAILQIPPGAVSIKATTSEKMGFIGRMQGIAVHAIATVFTHI